MSIRAVTRVTGASKNAVIQLMIDAGRFAPPSTMSMRAALSPVTSSAMIWSFTYAKAKNVAAAKAAPEGAGDTWTWTAIDADSKLMVSWLVGGRDGEYALAFMDDVAKRLANRVQLSTDGHRAYLEAVEGALGATWIML